MSWVSDQLAIESLHQLHFGVVFIAVVAVSSTRQHTRVRGTHTSRPASSDSTTRSAFLCWFNQDGMMRKLYQTNRASYAIMNLSINYRWSVAGVCGESGSRRADALS